MAQEPPERCARRRPGRSASGPTPGRLARAAPAAHRAALARHHGGRRHFQRPPQYLARPKLPCPARSPCRSRRACRAHHRPRSCAGEPGTADLLPRPAALLGRQFPSLAPAHRRLMAPPACDALLADNSARRGPQSGIRASGFCGPPDDQYGRSRRGGPGARAVRLAGRAARHSRRLERGLRDARRHRRRAAADGADLAADAAGTAAGPRRSAEPAARRLAGAGRASPGAAGGHEVCGLAGATGSGGWDTGPARVARAWKRRGAGAVCRGVRESSCGVRRMAGRVSRSTGGRPGDNGLRPASPGRSGWTGRCRVARPRTGRGGGAGPAGPEAIRRSAADRRGAASVAYPKATDHQATDHQATDHPADDRRRPADAVPPGEHAVPPGAGIARCHRPTATFRRAGVRSAVANPARGIARQPPGTPAVGLSAPVG